MTPQVWVTSDTICVSAPFDAVKAIEPGPTWNNALQAFTFPATSAVALQVSRAFTDLDTDHAFDDLVPAIDPDAHWKSATDPSPIPMLPGGGWLHQRRAYHWARNKSAAYFAIGMGGGKTALTAAMIEAWQSKRVLVVCPKKVIGHWPRQIDMYHDEDFWCSAPKDVPVAKRIESAKDALKLGDRTGFPSLVVINYASILNKDMQAFLRTAGFDLVVLDEAQNIKAHNGTTSKALWKVFKTAKVKPKKILLSGTPMPHSPGDIFAQYRFLDDTVFGTSWTRFHNRYVVMHPWIEHKILEWIRQDEMAAKMEPFMFQVGREVLDLPPVQHITHTVEIGPKARKLYREMEKDFYTAVDDGEITASNALVKLLRLQQMAAGFLVLDSEAGNFAKEDPVPPMWNRDMEAVKQEDRQVSRVVSQVLSAPEVCTNLPMHCMWKDDSVEKGEHQEHNGYVSGRLPSEHVKPEADMRGFRLSSCNDGERTLQPSLSKNEGHWDSGRSTEKTTDQMFGRGLRKNTGCEEAMPTSLREDEGEGGCWPVTPCKGELSLGKRGRVREPMGEWEDYSYSPRSNGGNSREASTHFRECPPCERCQVRQSPGKSGVMGQASAVRAESNRPIGVGDPELLRRNSWKDEPTHNDRRIVEIDTAKKDTLAEILDGLPVQEKVAVFCKFRHDLDNVRKVAESQGRRYGEVSGRQDDLIDSRFPPDTDVLGVQIQAGGAGVDLSAAAYCVYYTVGFSLGDYEQSLARTHRPGQERSVTYYHLIAEQTVDERVYAALSERKDVVTAVLERVS